MGAVRGSFPLVKEGFMLIPTSCGPWNTTPVRTIIRTHTSYGQELSPGTYTYHLMYRLFPKLGPHSHSLYLHIHPCLWPHMNQKALTLVYQGYAPGRGWLGSQDFGQCWPLTIAPQGGKWGWSRYADSHGSTLNRWYGCERMTRWQCLHKNSKYGIAKS
jgi:hypothetical protein